MHLTFLFFSTDSQNKERLKGEKIVPIELINNKSFNSSKGNSNQSSSNKSEKNIIDENNELKGSEKKSKTKKSLKSNNLEEIIKEDFNIMNKQIDKKKNKLSDKKLLLKKEKILENTKKSNPKKKGFSKKLDQKDLEKGSIKGQGKLKITCLNCVSPNYPRKALKKGLEGKPTVKAWILTDGNVEKAEIIISSGITSIDNAALEAAQKSKFYPIPYKSFMYIEYEMNIK